MPISDSERAVQARSFGAAARQYDTGRPSYPEVAIDWLLPDGARTVLDLGAGTGQLTRPLLTRHLDVVAVEPSDGMRDELTRALPAVRALAGSAEQIPLPDHSVDVVLVAQAWHWVDVEMAVPEVARVLTPGGRLGLVWNIRDEREDWVAELGRLMHQGIEQDMGAMNPRIGAPFGPVERFDVEWTHHLTPHDLLDLVASRSYVITLPADERHDLLTRVRHLIDTHPSLAGAQNIHLPYIARCSRANLL
ncbi:class I SAM-dependent methyltransferase [Pengzhenrongella phosphoraccumulans]|uniref:class I SAM-dependent methyltransferase n=1 Tax=Pengzhenrongella phosphoraccumulans TaxID=3114394 RepID=UPI00388D3DCE